MFVCLFVCFCLFLEFVSCSFGCSVLLGVFVCLLENLGVFWQLLTIYEIKKCLQMGIDLASSLSLNRIPSHTPNHVFSAGVNLNILGCFRCGDSKAIISWITCE